MAILLKKEYLKHYRDIAWLLIKYGHSDLVKHAGLDQTLAIDDHPSKGNKMANAEELAADLEKLGPTFIKIGQLLSTRPDFLPAEYLTALSRLQDHVAPFPFSDVEEIIVTELGTRLSKIFSEFNPEPIAAASLGQTHHAVLLDGREVAVKIQRPGIRASTIRDLEALTDIAEFYDRHTKAGKRYETSVMLEEFRKSLLAELDYRKEAHNLVSVKENLKEFKLLVIPSVITNYSTSKVLTMDFINGQKITSINGNHQDINGANLAEEIFKSYLKQVLVDGFFHADPHPGNILLTNDNKLALLDLGMVAHVTPLLQMQIFELLLAISEGRPDTAANICVEIGYPKEDFREQLFRKKIIELVQGHLDKDIENMNVGVVILGVNTAAAACGLRVPAELTMLSKAFLNLDQVGRTLNPSFSLNASIKHNAPKIIEQRLQKSLSSAHLFRHMIETRNFVDKLPDTVSKILDIVAHNRLQMKLNYIDQSIMIDAFQKVANRITLGFVLAALIICAGMLMRIQSPFMIFGYPVPAMICFGLAALVGFALIVHIAIYDQKAQKFD